MVRKAKLYTEGSSHLSKVLAHLNEEPKLKLSGLKSLKLSLAFRNDHFGARHFVKEDLPRIRYANPTLDIQVEKVKKTPSEIWRPEMELQFADGKHQIIDMHEKWSTSILKELMEVAGGNAWRRVKAERQAAGLPLVAGEENERKVVRRITIPPPSLKDFRASSGSTAHEA